MPHRTKLVYKEAPANGKGAYEEYECESYSLSPTLTAKAPSEIRQAFFKRGLLPTIPIRPTLKTPFNIWDVDTKFVFNDYFPHCNIVSFYESKQKDLNPRPANADGQVDYTYPQLAKDSVFFNDMNRWNTPKAIVSYATSLKCVNALVKICIKLQRIPCLVIVHKYAWAKYFIDYESKGDIWLCSNGDLSETS